jgi:NAD(P)-dependent dehydrogenase (short-subunit alcohol dehydrogenase family)
MSMATTSDSYSISRLFALEAKTVVLTGASGFLGRTFAQALLANGARVIALGRSDRLLQEGRKWKDQFGADRVVIHQIDMYNNAALRDLCGEIAVREKTIDALVNNAYELGPQSGFNTPSGSLENSSFEQWQRNLQCGVLWAVTTTQILGLRMKNQGFGSIVNIATMYSAVAPRPELYEGTTSLNPPAYSASKAALAAFSRYTASFWGRYGVRANCISPGPFSNTEDASGPNSVDEDSPFVARLKDYTLLHRIGRPIELCGALLFLASDASSYVTGQNIFIDGGWTAV